MTDNPYELFFNNEDEVRFFLDAIGPDDTVLEYGAGKSTHAIASHCKHLYSIEHDKKWYNEVVRGLPENVTLLHIARNSEEAPGDDGTAENYHDYINIVQVLDMGTGPTVCLVDGRARVHCARMISELYPDATIFIHDYGHPEEKYRRREYEVVEQFLEKTGQVFALAKFVTKK